MTTSIKEIKSEIRRLRKLKLACRAGSAERIALHRQIKELKQTKQTKQEENTEKEQLIVEILKLRPDYLKRLEIDYSKFSTEELTAHLARLKRR
jgi:uncharacterized coiled-coil DUF342 family protein